MGVSFILQLCYTIYSYYFIARTMRLFYWIVGACPLIFCFNERFRYVRKEKENSNRRSY